ncbi:hypothetical protein FCH28_09700 [Streptomyces piniterrae]|uniref:Uncharacterized protein n=1 Tax=Streptomyces piniterrae TaxID=2571125 RepID=A0A4U0NMX1_9ACTN|nr:hypothetical protein [Streptomyces piniterrae]TJZ55603.1 hypothetical protein FCH28_09700 [Streptomyces piniterrae]
MAATHKNLTLGAHRADEVAILRTRDRLQFREIADRLGCDVKTAHDAWKRARATYGKDAAAHLDAWRGEQLAVLDAIIDGLMPKAIAGDARAAEVIIKALERTAKTIGSDAPIRANVTVTDEMTARIKALAEELAEI